MHLDLLITYTLNNKYVFIYVDILLHLRVELFSRKNRTLEKIRCLDGFLLSFTSLNFLKDFIKFFLYLNALFVRKM